MGSGPGGLSAAIAAAREGVHTILVERYGCFGGTITQSSVESIASYRQEGTVESWGIGTEFEERAREMGASREETQSQSRALNTEMFKYVADKLVEEAGVVPVLHCFAVEPVMEEKTIKGIITESKSGRQAILAKRVIDATGDADIAYRAGAPYRQSPKEELMGVTVIFSCSGVNRNEFREYVQTHPSSLREVNREEVQKALAKQGVRTKF